MLTLAEIFLITNGRSTFKFSLRSIEAQSIKLKITVIENIKWVDALQKCNDLCKSDFYLRVDDDMFLHRHSVEYMLKSISKIKKIGVYTCGLWEDWSHRPGGYIKMYNINAARLVGFHANKLGKVDKLFFKSLSKTSYKHIKDKSLVGMHACGTIDDEANYRELWLKNNASIFYKEPKELDAARKRYNKNVDQQYLIVDSLFSKNKLYKTKFFYFIKNKK